ncbi:MAG: hypothetical protein M1127_01995 [Patescibacteria group bacterium]|nr:hypothetical protein [Patescibacteria group bacterium]
MTKQIIGYVLLGLGVAGILWGIITSYLIFTGKNPAPVIFSATATSQQAQTASTSQPVKTGKTGNDIEAVMQEQMQSVVGEQINKMLPTDFINRVLNLTVWAIFMGILFLGAGKLAGAGIGLLRSEKPVKN